MDETTLNDLKKFITQAVAYHTEPLAKRMDKLDDKIDNVRLELKHDMVTKNPFQIS